MKGLTIWPFFFQGVTAWWYSVYRDQEQEWQTTDAACQSSKQSWTPSALSQTSLWGGGVLSRAHQCYTLSSGVLQPNLLLERSVQTLDYLLRNCLATNSCQVQFSPLIDLFSLCFVFPTEVPGELNPLSFFNLCVDMQVNETKFERNCSLEYYHMTCIGKTKHTS